MKKIDGIYLQIKTTLAKPENKKKIAWGTIIGIISGLVLTLFLNLSSPPKKIEAAPSTVLDGTEVTATQRTGQHKIVRTTNGANGKRAFTLFYSANEVISLYYSDDPETGSPTWTSVGTVSTGGNDESADMEWDTVNNVLYIAYGRETPADAAVSDVNYKIVTALGGTPALGTERVALNATTSVNFTHPVIEIGQDSGAAAILIYANYYNNTAVNPSAIYLASTTTFNNDNPTFTTTANIKTWTAAAVSGVISIDRTNSNKTVIFYDNGVDLLATQQLDSADANAAASYCTLGGVTCAGVTTISADSMAGKMTGSIFGVPNSDAMWFSWLDSAFDINTRRWNGSTLDTELVPVAGAAVVLGPAIVGNSSNLYMVYQKVSDTTLLVYQSRPLTDGTNAWSGTETTLEDHATENLTYPSIGAVMNQDYLDVIYTTATNAIVRHASVSLPPPISISGTCNQYDRSGVCGDAGAEVIAVAINGVLQGQTDGTVDGSWTITGITRPAANASIIVFINGEATASERATAVTKYNSSGTGDVGGITLFQRHVTIGSDQNTTVANTDMDDYDYNAGADADDADIIYDVDASNDLTVDNLGSYSDEMLLVLASDTYQPDSASSGNVNTHDFEIDGTVTANNNTFYIGGSWNNDATFTANGSTVNFNSTTGTETIDSTGASVSLFNALTHTGASTLQLSSAIDVNSGGFSQTAGTFNSNSQNQNFSGAFSLSAGTTYTKGGTLTFDAAGSQVVTDSTAAPGRDLGLVTIGPSTTTSVSTANKMNVTDLTIGADDTLDISSDTLSIAGNYINSNTLTTTSSTVDFTKGSSTQTLNSGGTGAGKSFNNFTHSGAGTLQLTTNAINIDGIFTNSNGTFDANDLNMNVADDFLISGGSFSADVSPGATTQTVTFDGTNEATVSGSNTFRNLTMNTTTDGAKTIKFTIATIQTISNTWTLDGAVGKVLTLRSTSDTTAWGFAIPADINPAGDYIDVKDSQNNTNAYRITAGTNYVDSGNNVPGWLFPATNTAPNDPSFLAQKKTTDVTITVNTWTNETSVKFTATASDTDNPDTLYLCIEKDQTGTAFSNTEDSCGSGVAYSGTPVTVINTISSQTDATAYHWQARIKDAANAYSGWISFGGNTDPNDMDYGIDTTAPTGGSVINDSNTGSLTQLSATWNSFDSNVSGLQKYQYAVGTTAGGSDIKTWTDNGTSTSATATSLNLQTSADYYFSVKAFDNAGNTGSAVSAAAQQVLPTISYTIGSNTINFNNLNQSNSYTDTKTNALNVQTNANNGYVVRSYITQVLTSLDYPSKTISNYSATWASPTTWTGYGFGYTSSDTDVQGSNRFGSGTKYCAFLLVPSGDIVADHTAAINGSTGAANDDWTITYKVATSPSQEASTYQTTGYFIVVPNY